MRTSQKTHEQLEDFFREYYVDEDLELPKINLHLKGVSAFITTTLKIHGITIGKNIFIRPEIMYRDLDQQLCIPKDLLAHEATHVLQYKKLGFFRFLYTYLKGYWKGLKNKKKWDAASRREAYLEIPHEVEARECAARFLKWLEKKETVSE